ncbi:hypothetical protein X929_03210 [Petrotoga olearia DSM 13574]|uniref:Cell shape protein MreC n=1 Tax=Petrotoga olearia DSM 13574 TaxID=1122955 RepID=A0A2K1P3V5_9BACT|nr:hypothetical protein X929_03210 [Petrotoga olearia DSM 13574]
MIFISILFNTFENLRVILDPLTYPVDMVFSLFHSKILERGSSAEKISSILDELNKKPLYLIESKNSENIDLTIPRGIILSATNRNFNVLTNNESNLEKGYLAVSTDGILLGFVENMFSDRVVVRKLGWGDQQFFGKIGIVDVLIKEDKGNLLVEIPDNYNVVMEQHLKIDLPAYVKGGEKESIFLSGEIVSKYGDLYLFNPVKINDFLVYFFPY